MSKRELSLVIILISLNYIIFSQLFIRIAGDVSPTPTVKSVVISTPTSALPTFTPSPTQHIVIATFTSTPLPILLSSPTDTVTPTVAESHEDGENDNNENEVLPTPTSVKAMVMASNTAVNLRTGPGINYELVGVLDLGASLEIVGRNARSSWWQVKYINGLVWIAASVTTASNADDVPIVSPESIPTLPPQAIVPTSTYPPPTYTSVPLPASTPVTLPTSTPSFQYQYTTNNIFPQVNEAITQIRGYIEDVNGNPVNGVRVRVRVDGGFCTVSVPSGEAGVYPAGNYDILLDGRAKPGNWKVAIVNASSSGPSGCNGAEVLSEEKEVPTDTMYGVVYVEWRKNY
ncbi:MAG: hypothetical protein B6242_00115 [Anaerolineaceae bacterium 4572_78]|nr:MAG: hypothetical protein B6242_00115 [Anaerolineaceae bacterium 4572_78]